MTFFCVDAYDPVENTPCVLEYFRQLNNSDWYALLDLACIHSEPLPYWYRQGFCLYDNTPWKALAAVSPTLYALSGNTPDELSQLVRRLMSWCNAKPMLSFFATQIQLQELVSCWQSHLSVCTTDNDHYLLRFADTRVAACLPAVLTSEHWAQLTAPLDAWLILNRAGQIQPLALPQSGFVPGTPTETITLSPSELEAFVAAAEPDAIIQIIQKDFPELLKGESRVSIYQRVAWICQQAKLHQIEAVPDLVALAVAELSFDHEQTGQWFGQDKVQTLMRQKSWPDGQLSGALAEVLA